MTADGAWHATAPEVPVVSTVGAGDSSVAGYILADVNGGDEAERLRTAMAYRLGRRLPARNHPAHARRPARAGGCRHPALLSRGVHGRRGRGPASRGSPHTPAATG